MVSSQYGKNNAVAVATLDTELYFDYTYILSIVFIFYQSDTY